MREGCGWSRGAAWNMSVLPLTFRLPFVSCNLEKLQDISSFSPYLVCDAHFWGHDHFISFSIPLCCFEEILL